MSDNNFLRAPNRRIDLTEHQLREFIKCADPVTGYKHFMTNYFYIQHPVKGQLLYDPYPFQDDLIANYHDNRYSISMLARQMGKTTSAAGYLLWFAMFNADKTVLIAAHQYTGAQEIMDRIRYAYEMCPIWLKAGVETYNKGNIDFDNKSRIVARATTEKTGRGMSLSLLYLDEFSYVRPTIAKEFWTSISPTLATGGKCIITSTPNSDEDTFAEIWKGANKQEDEFGNPTKLGINGFSPYKVTWEAHPDRDDKWAQEERSKIGDDRFKREMECEFILFEETLIRASTLMDLQSTEPIERQGQVRWYHKPCKGNLYTIALDPSLGTGGDNAAIQIFEANTTRQIGEWKHNKTTIPEQIRLIASIAQYIADITGDKDSIYYSVENNTIGEAALISLEEYGEHNIPAVMISGTRDPYSSRRYRRGFNTTAKSKLSACAKLKSLVESGKMTIHSKPLISELKTFVATGNSYKARLGETDDLVMALVLTVRMLQHLQSFHVDLETQIRDFDEIIEPYPFIMVMA